MMGFTLRLASAVFFGLEAAALAQGPVSCHLSFENLDFAKHDWVEQTGLKTIAERKWELVDGRFGKALFLGAVPMKYDSDNMSGLDLDLVSGVAFNMGGGQGKDRGYDELFVWGAGKLHPAFGAIAFWVKGSSRPEPQDVRTVLFEQTTTTWGRKERQLLEIELHRDRSITAYVEDARYVPHSVRAKEVWKDDVWNHIVFMWDKGAGVSLWVNGEEAASSMGEDAWWENQLPGLFHLPMALGAYDEFYVFHRTLTKKEIGELYRENRAPRDRWAAASTPLQSTTNLCDAFSTDTSSLPVARPSSGETLVFEEIAPERIDDEGIQGWWIADGRYELAWPHEYSVFTIIPGDVDFHAENADILPPKGSQVNYLTFEGNLDGVSVLRGDRRGHFDPTPVLTVPKTKGFFYGAAVRALGDAELRIPLTKSHGSPPGFQSDGDVLNLPLSGDLRLHEVGLFHVSRQNLPAAPGRMTMYLNPRPVRWDDDRYPAAMNALFCSKDRRAAGLHPTLEAAKPSTIDIPAMSRLHLISEPAAGKYAFDALVADLWIRSPSDEAAVQFRLRDPAVPSHTWSHAEARLRGFTGDGARLRVALRFEPAFLVSGDRLWLEVMPTKDLSVLCCDGARPSTVTLLPDIDWVRAEQKFALKAMRPNILVYGRSFEYIPWEWDKRMPDVDAPTSFGGMFDMAYPWQAVLKVAPGDRLANIYRDYATGKYVRGRWPADMDHLPDRGIRAPDNAPDWAVSFRELQTFRKRIVAWWRRHQRSDGQVGGGWNDDTLIFSRALGDMPLDSDQDALALYNNVFKGFDKTNYFKDGYCRISPIDRLHNGDFVRERYKSLVYNLGDPQSAVWAMEEAWHWGKPDGTPANYGDGKAFLFGRDVMHWYWGRQVSPKPYRLTNKAAVVETLRKAALANDEATLWRFTEAWCHTDDQSQYGASILYDVLFGGWGSAPRRSDFDSMQRNIAISVGVGWPQGGGPQLGRLVEYSGDDGLQVHMHSFDQFDRKVAARLYRIVDGLYRVALRADQNGDGVYDAVVSRAEKKLRRFDTLQLAIPPQTPVLLEVTQIAADPRPGDMPDLATSSDYVSLHGNTLTVTVLNIGSAPSGEFSIDVRRPNTGVLRTLRVGSIPGSNDFTPKKTTVIVPDLPAPPPYHICVDPSNTVKEIFEENNSAVAAGNPQLGE